MGVCRDPGQKNQESQYDSSFSVNHIMVAHLTRSYCEGLKCAVYSMQCFTKIHCGKAVTGLWMVAMNVRNIKVQMKSDMFGAFSEMFFLSKCHVTGVVLDSDKLIFTWLARARERERGERERVCVCARARVCAHTHTHSNITSHKPHSHTCQPTHTLTYFLEEFCLLCHGIPVQLLVWVGSWNLVYQTELRNAR